MSENPQFDSSHISDSIKEIDVRADGRQDGKEEKKLEQLAINHLNTMQTNGASPEQLKLAFESFADALIQKYTPLIEANITQVMISYPN